VLSDPKLLRPVSGYALTYLEVLSLSREDFMQVIQRRRRSCPQLFSVVRRYLVRLAAYRGILLEAKRRKLLNLRSPDSCAPLPPTTHMPPMMSPKLSPRTPHSVRFAGDDSFLSLPGGVDSANLPVEK